MRLKHPNSPSGVDKSSNSAPTLRSVLWGMIFWNPVPKEKLQQLNLEAMKSHEEIQKTLAASQKIRSEAQQTMEATSKLY